MKVNVREAREKLSSLLNEAEKGQVIAITRHGKVVAELSPPHPQEARQFPDLTAFRKSIKVRTSTPSAATLVRQLREKERF